MLDINIIVITGTIFLMFLILLAIYEKNADARLRFVEGMFSFLKEASPFKPQQYTETPLDEYKDAKRVRLIVNGKLLEDLSLAEHEALCGVHGIDPNSPVEFRVETDPNKQGNNIMPFPQN